MADVYQIVTEKIITSLEKGVVPWKKPWISTRTGAYNRISGKPYSLFNQLLLNHPGEYATFKQWTELGCTIKEGEKGEIVCYYKMPDSADRPEGLKMPENTDEPSKDMTNPEKPRRTRPILRYYRVYHISQIDGEIEPSVRADEPRLFDTEPIEEADRISRIYLAREGIKLISEISDEAYYMPSTDSIHIPEIKQFEFPEEYYSTLYHECVHSTGHIKRLGRIADRRVAFGSEKYSREELVAEIGSMVLLSMIGINTDDTDSNSAAYIGGWLRALKDDKKLVVIAAGQADKAVRYMLGQAL